MRMLWLVSMGGLVTPKLGWATPDTVTLERLLQGAPAHVRCAILTADELARQQVSYRAIGLMKRQDLERPPLALSCSELVYYAYARCGVELGQAPQRTRPLAFERPPPYQAGMRLVEARELQVGDVLVYHRDKEIVEREVAHKGFARPGHVVILVSEAQGLTIGSHGRESTPKDAPVGVGYRVQPSLERWDTDRTLRAIYRPVATSTGALSSTSTSTTGPR